MKFRGLTTVTQGGCRWLLEPALLFWYEAELPVQTLRGPALDRSLVFFGPEFTNL